MKKTLIISFDFSFKSIEIPDIDINVSKGDDFTLTKWSDFTTDEELLQTIQNIIDRDRIVVYFVDHRITREQHDTMIHLIPMSIIENE